MKKHTYINLTKGKKAIIDLSDYPKVSKYKWCSEHADRNQTYAITRHKNKIIRMHWLILGKRVGIADHINSNTLDNRRKNLRICTSNQNAQNQSKQKNCSSVYKGVSWSKDRNLWHSKVKHNGIYYNLGRFNSQKKAALAYNKKAKKLFGKYAKLNKV